MNDILKFSHDDYLKLERPLFPTIRRRDKYPEEGSCLNVKTPERSFGAMVVFKLEKKLSQIPTRFLRYDTARKNNIPKNRNKAIEVLNSFYKNPIGMNEKLTILICLTRQEVINLE